jgi:hypothetical protein
MERTLNACPTTSAEGQREQSRGRALNESMGDASQSLHGCCAEGGIPDPLGASRFVRCSERFGVMSSLRDGATSFRNWPLSDRT